MYNVVCSLMMGHSQKLDSLLRVHLGSVKQLPTDPVVLGVVCVCVCVCMHTCVYKGHPISLHGTLGNVSLATQMELEARHLPFLLPHGSLCSRTCSVAPHLKGDL